MWNGLILETKRCPDGVALFDYGPTQLVAGGSPPSGLGFRYCSDRRDPVRIERVDLETPVVLAFVNATTDDDQLKFFTRFGLTFGSRTAMEAPDRFLDRQQILERQQVHLMLLQTISIDQAIAMELINGLIASHQSFNLRPEIRLGDGEHHLMLKSETIAGFMLMELAMAAAHGVKLARCEHCDRAYLTGPLTWRRSHAKYCAEKCRAAAMRARNSERKRG